MLAVVTATGLVLSAGCGYTASPALLPQHLKTVAIPVFENGTPEAQLESELTDAVIQRFVKDNQIRPDRCPISQRSRWSRAPCATGARIPRCLRQ